MVHGEPLTPSATPIRTLQHNTTTPGHVPLTQVARHRAVHARRAADPPVERDARLQHLQAQHRAPVSLGAGVTPSCKTLPPAQAQTCQEHATTQALP